MKLEAVNALDRAAFVDAFGDIAEESPWVAENVAAQAPFPSREALIAAFCAALQRRGRRPPRGRLRAPGSGR